MKSLFDDVPGIVFHRNPSACYDSNYWLNTITLSPDLHVAGRRRLI